jgi:hypothetical protein
MTAIVNMAAMIFKYMTASLKKEPAFTQRANVTRDPQGAATRSSPRGEKDRARVAAVRGAAPAIDTLSGEGSVADIPNLVAELR